MLNWLKLVDCQSHKETYFEFDPYGINVIIGENNAGKTAVLRALYAWAFNPKGYFSKLKRWKKHWPIITGHWDGHEIIRYEKGYILNGKEYKTVGDTVPRDIANILNLDPINFKLIRENLFLIEESPGERARIINRASGLDSQEELIAYCKTQIKNYTDEIKIKEHLRTSLISTVSRLSPVEDLKSPIEKLGISLKRIEKIEDEFEDITGKVERLTELASLIELDSDVKNIRSQAIEANSLLERATKIGGEIAGISYSIGELERIKKVLYKEDLVRDLRKYARRLEEKDVEIRKAEIDWNSVADAIERLDQLIIDAKVLTREVEIAVVKRDEARLEAGICPLCDTDLREGK